jgi:hypothetical protein
MSEPAKAESNGWVLVDSQFILFILRILSAPLGFCMVTGQKIEKNKKEQKKNKKEHK